MGRRSAAETENHWPGFVDALSTIVMVVTFLLIILAIVIFVLSQSIARSFVESMSEQTAMGGGDITSQDPLTATEEFPADAPPTDELGTPVAVMAPPPVPAAPDAPTPASPPPATAAVPESPTPPTTPAPPTLADGATSTEGQANEGDAVTERAEELLAEDPVADAEDLAIRSRRVLEEEERIVVAEPDLEVEEAPNRVTEAATFLTIAFDPAGTRIDDDTSARIADFLNRSEDQLRDQQIAIWAFTDFGTASVSQARRVAYYRALAARNQLLEAGLDPENVSLEIRPSPAPENTDTVRLVVR